MSGCRSSPGPLATGTPASTAGPGALLDVGGPRRGGVLVPRQGLGVRATFGSAAGRSAGGRSPCRCARPANGPGWSSRSVLRATWDVDCSAAATATWSPRSRGRPTRTVSSPARRPVRPAVLADNDDELDSYGVEIGVRDLATQPRHATASVRVTSANGKSVTIPTKLEPAVLREGSLWFQASDDEGRRATELGDGPFTYTVDAGPRRRDLHRPRRVADRRDRGHRAARAADLDTGARPATRADGRLRR